jgi:hypothetical protein
MLWAVYSTFMAIKRNMREERYHIPVICRIAGSSLESLCPQITQSPEDGGDMPVSIEIAVDLLTNKSNANEYYVLNIINILTQHLLLFVSIEVKIKFKGSHHCVPTDT